MDNQQPMTATSEISTFGDPTFRPSGQSSVANPEHIRVAKAGTWPVVFVLAVIPTANVQVPLSSFPSSETCTYSSSKKERYSVTTFGVFSRWEDIGVPQIQTVGHIKATLKFQGTLKWLPFQP